jgi:sugar/nucleoside kinase (ribokinase family)
MPNNFDLISIGDASIDVFMSPTESETLCQLDDRKSLICFTYGDKIPVKNLEFTTGGNAANNAVGVSRFGLKVAIVLTVGDDNIGGLITDKVKSEGVNMDYVTKQPGSGSNYSTVINYSGERTIFVYHAPRRYEFPAYLSPAPWAYLTSMGESFGPFYKRVADWLGQNPGVKLAFNPGSYQMRAPKGEIEPILARTQVIFINREEAEKITGFEDSKGKEKELLGAVRELGPKVVIITDGGGGSIVYDGSKYIKAGVLPVDAYERTGAGDAFGSGSLSAIIKGKSLDEALVWGTLNSASVIGFVGPQKGLLKESDIENWKERYISSGVKVEEF